MCVFQLIFFLFFVINNVYPDHQKKAGFGSRYKRIQIVGRVFVKVQVLVLYNTYLFQNGDAGHQRHQGGSFSALKQGAENKKPKIRPTGSWLLHRLIRVSWCYVTCDRCSFIEEKCTPMFGLRKFRNYLGIINILTHLMRIWLEVFAVSIVLAVYS